MNDQKKINDPIIRLVLTALVPAFVYGGMKLWNLFSNKVLKPLGINVTVSEAQVEAVVNWILNLIMDAETTGKSGEDKYNTVLKAVKTLASEDQMKVIRKTWGTPETAVQSIFNAKAQQVIELKKLNKK